MNSIFINNYVGFVNPPAQSLIAAVMEFGNGNPTKLRNEEENWKNLFCYYFYKDNRESDIVKFFERLGDEIPEVFKKEYIGMSIMGFTTPEPTQMILKQYKKIHGIEFLSDSIFEILISENRSALRHRYSANRYHCPPVKYFFDLGVSPNVEKDGLRLLDHIIIGFMVINPNTYKYGHSVHEVNGNIKCTIEMGGKMYNEIQDNEFLDNDLLRNAMVKYPKRAA